jgi:hypothetical protein
VLVADTDVEEAVVVLPGPTDASDEEALAPPMPVAVVVVLLVTVSPELSSPPSSPVPLPPVLPTAHAPSDEPSAVTNPTPKSQLEKRTFIDSRPPRVPSRPALARAATNQTST